MPDRALCILRSSYQGTSSAFSQHDPAMDPARFLPGWRLDTVLVCKRTAREQLGRLAGAGYDAFINLCDGAADEETAGIEVVRELERLGLPFTGARSDFYEPTRAAMKEACAAAGVPAPAAAPAALRFPLIVKHPNSYGSVGLHRGSRVDDEPALRREVARMTAAHGAALIEEYIDGREFSVLVVENPDDARRPLALKPVELLFPPGESFKHFDLKWIDHEGITQRPTGDPALDERLMELSRRLFVALNGSGYGRCDLRMDRDGRLFMLEINPNCGVFYPEDAAGTADLILLHDPLGHGGFVELILRAARG